MSEKSSMENLADYAEYINGVAALIVGHRAILMESGMNPVIVDQCCLNLHGFFLGMDAQELNALAELEYHEEEDD